MAAVGLLAVPLGTLISLYILWVLLSEKGNIIFSPPVSTRDRCDAPYQAQYLTHRLGFCGAVDRTGIDGGQWVCSICLEVWVKQ